MFKIEKWNQDLNLSEFYSEAKKRGYENNSNQQIMIDCLSKEKEWGVWILYHDITAVASVAAHSFPEMGENSYRIAARTCVLTSLVPTPRWFTDQRTLGTFNGLATHQHVTSQFLIPTCIDWAPKGSNLYITTNENSMGKQKAVHKIFAPMLESKGVMKRICDLEYRGSLQTVWQIYPDKFYEDLNKYPRWK